MTSASNKPPPIPAPNVPVLNKDGTMSREWYAFLQALAAALQVLRTEV